MIITESLWTTLAKLAPEDPSYGGKEGGCRFCQGGPKSIQGMSSGAALDEHAVSCPWVAARLLLGDLVRGGKLVPARICTERGTGRTSQQLRMAPLGAMFVCTPGSAQYTVELAEYLRRCDIDIRTTDSFAFFKPIFAGSFKPKHVVVDHAVQLLDDHVSVLHYAAVRGADVVLPDGSLLR